MINQIATCAAGALLALTLASFSAAGAAGVDAGADPERLVRLTTESVQTSLRALPAADREDRDRLVAVVETHVSPHVDFELLSSRMVGQEHWKAATEEQRAAFGREFAKLLARNYSLALAELSDAEVDYRSAVYSKSGQRARVRASVRVGQGGPIPVDYKLSRRGDRWRLYDLQIAGVSTLAILQYSFAAHVRAGGIDNLIGVLVAMNER